MKVISRTELFDAVWDRPLDALAADMGVVAAELKRACRRHNIPVPAHGYWLQVAQGKIFPKPPLAPAPPRLEEIRLEPQSTPATKVVTAPKRITPPDRAQTHPRVEPPAPSDEPESAGRPSPALKVTVSTRLQTPHRIIAAWIEEERRDRERWGRSYGSPATPEAKALERRRLLILDALFKALEKRDHRIEVDRGSIYLTHFQISGQHIDYVVKEGVAQRRVALTDAELNDPDNIRQHRQYRQLREPTGKFQLTLKGLDSYEKATWKDQDDLPLEAQLSDVVLGAEALAAKVKAERTRRDELERERNLESLRKYEQRQREKREANQWQRLRELAGRRAEADRMRTFIAEMRRRADTAVDAELEAWFSWAEKWAAAWDPLTHGVTAIVDDVRAVTEWDYRSDNKM